MRFTETVLNDPSRADEIRAEPVEDYTARRKFEIANPCRRGTMARKTTKEYIHEIADLKDQLTDLQDENEALQDRLDSIVDVATGEEEEDEEYDEGN